ncbi:MAG: HAD hydrolase family protein [Legionellales bacterium]|nr:HAD hydrolase family protein [Legionellales bacterium]
MQSLITQAQNIKLLIADLDGVLTDGRFFLNGDGDYALMAFHNHDGIGIRLLQSSGVVFAVITGSRHTIIEQRMQSLGVEHLYQGYIDKQSPYTQLKQQLQLPANQIAYIGDDIADLPIMRQVGLSIAVANATPLIRDLADWQTTQAGGFGAVREACDLILQSQNTLTQAITDYLASQ